MKRTRKSGKNYPKRLSEAENTIVALKHLLKSRKDSERTFAKQKLKAYERADVLKSGVRIKRKGEVKQSTPSPGDVLKVSYAGALANGRFFDSGTFSFTLGKGEVIKAWDEAFKYINEGQEATIFCPSSTAYGKKGAGKQIPPFSTLIFDVTLLKVHRNAVKMNSLNTENY